LGCSPAVVSRRSLNPAPGSESHQAIPNHNSRTTQGHWGWNWKGSSEGYSSAVRWIVSLWYAGRIPWNTTLSKPITFGNPLQSYVSGVPYFDWRIFSYFNDLVSALTFIQGNSPYKK
jgi:hypothetical protein